MFHAPTGRFYIELIIILPIFPQLSHLPVVCFFPVGLSSLIRHFEQVLWVLKFHSPTGKKHTTVGWDDGGKIGKVVIIYKKVTKWKRKVLRYG